MNAAVRKVALLALVAFTVIAFYLTYLILIQGDRLAAHPMNRRQSRIEQMIDRGGIFDRQGEKIAETVWEGSRARRVYPRGRVFAHLVGYTSVKYGKAGLEAAFNEELLGLTGLGRLENLAARLLGRRPQGHNLHLTVDSRLQSLAVDMLGNRRGAVVAIEPQTGKILVLASAPGFAPESIEEQFEEISQRPDSPLLNRAVQGLYPPGSTMKLVTGAVALSRSLADVTEKIDCPGYLMIEGRRLGDSGVHGQVDFDRALAVSCNTFFGRLGVALGEQEFARGAKQFGFNREIPFSLPVEQSRFPADGKLTANGLAEAAIGQGEVVATPLQMAMVAAAVANGGIMMKPFLVETVTDSTGRIVAETRPAVLEQPVDEKTANRVLEAMVTAVRVGTGRAAALPGVAVAGKTGSAENPHGDPHAWFIGIAPAEQPRVAVAVIVENAGAGGKAAAPIAREVMREALKNVR